jgi:3-hydroxyacyl-CoA dehydrogenase/enoyl-CoA hydratase/3-hydroxybutyryl-CoA epimerase/3-hydroxyacyl-CoA dehydrogenase/enoyl-CoA hydratase/3-hydroxybutyryl-CoA epimerase/enoyl-CoA isomerase
VNDGPGFLVNRILFPYMNEAVELLLDGVSPREIDKAALTFGMPIGPVALYDLVGLDTALYAGRTMWEAFPDRVLASPLVPALVKAGRLGQKTGRGFFRYDNKKGRAEDDPEVLPIIETYRRPARKISKDEITHRIFLSMLLEATRVLDDHVARDVRDIDLGVIFGLGFPPFRGGLLFWADTVGASQIIEWLKPLEGLGPRLQPTARLRQMAADGGKFYPAASTSAAGKVERSL